METEGVDRLFDIQNGTVFFGNVPPGAVELPALQDTKVWRMVLCTREFYWPARSLASAVFRYLMEVAEVLDGRSVEELAHPGSLYPGPVAGDRGLRLCRRLLLLWAAAPCPCCITGRPAADFDVRSEALERLAEPPAFLTSIHSDRNYARALLAEFEC